KRIYNHFRAPADKDLIPYISSSTSASPKVPHVIILIIILNLSLTGSILHGFGNIFRTNRSIEASPELLSHTAVKETKTCSYVKEVCEDSILVFCPASDDKRAMKPMEIEEVSLSICRGLNLPFSPVYDFRVDNLVLEGIVNTRQYKHNYTPKVNNGL
ncbi:hypothetical protein LCGC14_2664300, partial [marine sediment metagenome]